MKSEFVLDSDILIFLQRGHPDVVKKMAAIPSERFCTTIINHAELYCGCFHRTHGKAATIFYDALFARLPVLPLTVESSLIFARTKARMLERGQTVADMDILIASIAIAHRMTLITNNLRDFQKIEGLQCKTWLR